MRVSNAINLYLRWSEQSHTKITIKTYRSRLNFFQNFVSEKEIDKINLFDDIVGFSEKLQNQGMSDNSIRLSMIALRQFWSFLESVGPSFGVTVPFTKNAIPVKKNQKVKSHPPITGEDFDKICQKFKGENWIEIRDEAIIRFLYSTGVRVGELVDLDTTSLDLSNRTATVMTEKRRDLIKKRVTPYTKITQLALINWLGIRQEKSKSKALFVNTRGRRLTTRSIQRTVKSYCEAVGVHYSPHSFRHGLGMRSAESQMYPPHLQELLGHSNLNSSKIYYNIRNIPLIKEYHKRVGDNQPKKVDNNKQLDYTLARVNQAK